MGRGLWEGDGLCRWAAPAPSLSSTRSVWRHQGYRALGSWRGLQAHPELSVRVQLGTGLGLRSRSPHLQGGDSDHGRCWPSLSRYLTHVLTLQVGILRLGGRCSHKSSRNRFEPSSRSPRTQQLHPRVAGPSPGVARAGTGKTPPVRE